MTQNEFHKKMFEVYKDENYDFSKFQYTGIKNYINIVCKNKDKDGNEHGLFSVRADNIIYKHLHCPKCTREAIANKVRKNNIDFINEVRTLYGENKFDFDKCEEYVTAKTPIKMYCNEHKGYITITPTHLLANDGCKICNRILNYKNIIKELNPNLEVIFEGEIKDKKSIVTIMCPIHGAIKLAIKDILKTPVCPLCNKEEEILKFTNEFKSKAKKIHGDKYDYTKVIFQSHSLQEKVAIKCKKDNNIFIQSAYNHLKGQGCPQCAKQRMTSEEFKIKYYNRFGKKYNIDNINYVNSSSHIEVVCPIHGKFLITPCNLLNGKGCPKCAGRKLTTEEKILRLKEKHQNKYDYSEIKIIPTAQSKITPICPIHGKFEITYNHHLSGEGCPACKSSKLEHIVYETLSSYDINFVYDKQCSCLDKQRPDFYLPDYNLIIECQGRQHFIKFAFTDFEEKEKLFQLQLKRDYTKYKNSIKNNINVIYFVPKIEQDYLNNKIFNGIYKIDNMFDKIEDLINYILSIKNETLQEIPENIVYD